MSNLRFPDKYPYLSYLNFNRLLHKKLEESNYDPTQFEIRSIEICKSTNDEVAKHLKSYPFSVVLSMTQEEGRGRDGKVWESPIGGLWLSIGFKTSSKVIEISSLVVQAVNRVLSNYANTEIKAPNDILINHKKLCGILVESKSSGQVFEQIIVGLGINVFNDIPEDLVNIATRLKDHSNPPSIPELATLITSEVLSDLSFLF